MNPDRLKRVVRSNVSHFRKFYGDDAAAVVAAMYEQLKKEAHVNQQNQDQDPIDSFYCNGCERAIERPRPVR